MARLVEENAGRLSRYLEEERAIVPVDGPALRAYLESFVRAVPWVLRRAYPARVAFTIQQEPGPPSYVVVDLGRNRVEVAATIPADLHSRVSANGHMLRDAVDKACLNLVGISKRIQVHLYRGGLVCDAAFWGLLAVYELGYLPVRRVITRRGVGVLASRWRELIAYVRAFVRPSKSLTSIMETWEPR